MKPLGASSKVVFTFGFHISQYKELLHLHLKFCVVSLIFLHLCNNSGAACHWCYKSAVCEYN